jgi:hypothetical protein
LDFQLFGKAKVKKISTKGTLRASSVVCQIELSSLIFGEKCLKYFSNNLVKDLTSFGNLGKISFHRVNIHATLAVGIVVSGPVER